MALAQQTGILLLDEPTTFLDLAHQVDVLDLLADLEPARGRTIVMVLHDLNQAVPLRRPPRRDARRARRSPPGRPARSSTTDARARRLRRSTPASSTDPVTGTPLCLPIAKPRRTRCVT